MEERNLTAVGRIAKVFGRAGELSIHLYDNFPEDFNRAEPLFITIDGLAVPLFCDHFQRRGQRGATVVFADIDTERRSAEVVGQELSMELSDHPFGDTDDRMDGEELIGYTAVLPGNVAGVITDFTDGDNPLFQVDVNGTEAWIPVVDDFIVEIDPDSKEIRFELPEGLLELYL